MEDLGSAELRATREAGRILRFDPGDASMTFKVELADRVDWFPLDAVEVTSGSLVEAVEKMRRTQHHQSEQGGKSRGQDGWTLRLGERISRHDMWAERLISAGFVDCCDIPRMVVTMAKIVDSDVANVSFTNMSGDAVLCIPYKSQQDISEVLDLLSQKVGVPSCGIDLIHADGRSVHCPDHATMARTLEEESPVSTDELTPSRLALLKQKARDLCSRVYGIGTEPPLTQWYSSDEGKTLWDTMKFMLVERELNSCLGLDLDSPVELEQSFITACRYPDARARDGSQHEERLHALVLSNNVIVLLLEHAYLHNAFSSSWS